MHCNYANRSAVPFCSLFASGSGPSVRQPSGGMSLPSVPSTASTTAYQRPAQCPVKHAPLPSHASSNDQCCPSSWRPRSRHNSRPRGRGAAGGPSAEPCHSSSIRAHSFHWQLPPRGSASGFWRGFSAASTARLGFRRAAASASRRVDSTTRPGGAAASAAWRSFRWQLSPARGTRRAA